MTKLKLKNQKRVIIQFIINLDMRSTEILKDDDFGFDFSPNELKKSVKKQNLLSKDELEKATQTLIEEGINL